MNQAYTNVPLVLLMQYRAKYLDEMNTPGKIAPTTRVRIALELIALNNAIAAASARKALRK